MCIRDRGSEGEDVDVPDTPPASVLKEGDTGVGVQAVQYMLRVASQFFAEIPDVDMDGVFGPITKNAVKSFQSYFGLIPDGIVGHATWQQMIDIYKPVSYTHLDVYKRQG